MDKTKMMQHLMATFREELEEHVRAFNQNLLSLEKIVSAPERAERFTLLFRTAHSLKGAARAVNVDLIEGACHRLEEILTMARDGRAALDADMMALLFATVDAIEEAGMRLREQQDLAGAPLASLLPQLDVAAGKPGPTVTSAPAKPVSLVPTSSSNPGKEPTLETPASSHVRVPAEKLDMLLARVGELLVAQRRVHERLGDLAAIQDLVARWKTDWKQVESVFAREHSLGTAAPVVPRRAALALRQTGDNLRRLDKALDRLAAGMTGDSRLFERATRPVHDEVRRVRMLPFIESCAGLDRMVRDLALAAGKEVELTIGGDSVQMDRSILEGLKDPLRHLVRNALDHGVESPAQRQQAGKTRQARISVTASLRGAQVEVIVQDDGRGLDLDAIRAQAQHLKLEAPANDRDLVRMIFLPGFSTAPIVTDVSGRGVGLDVVKTQVEALHGTVDLFSEAGQGTRFVLTVPLTLTTLRAVLVSAGGQTYAFAGTNVLRVAQVNLADIRTVAAREVLSMDGSLLPLASLTTALDSGIEPATPSGRLLALIVAAGTARMAFLVDSVLAEEEVVVKNLGARVRRLPLVAGATLLPSGKIALLLNAGNVVRSVLRRRATPVRSSLEPSADRQPAKKRLLIAEDSVTTRTLMKSILEAAGYAVIAAVDGQAAWQWLQENKADVVVSDVDMPNMNGFELTATLRASPAYRDLPVVLVTARENETDKVHGIEAGANAYLVKSAFDQRNLLETIAQLL
jgi:two-component system chemotaxis sensor kinase CheA